MLLSEYDRHDLVLSPADKGVFVARGRYTRLSAVSTSGSVGMRYGRRRRRCRRGDTVCGRVSSCWRWSFLSKGVNGTLWDASVWMWCAAAVCLLGGSTLLLGAVERWRRTQWEKEKNMAIKFQYNKTSLGRCARSSRCASVPFRPLKAKKESALRLEVKKARDAAAGGAGAHGGAARPVMNTCRRSGANSTPVC